MKKKSIGPILLVSLFLVLGLAAGLVIANNQDKIPLLNKRVSDQETEDKYLAFLHEVQDLVKENYWDTINEEHFIKLHILAIEKLTGNTLGDGIKNYEDLDQKILSLLNDYPEEELKQEFVTQLADLVLANLEPFGRSRLYSQQLKQELSERVNNINPEVDHYQVLDIAKDASTEEINQAYEKQEEVLAEDKSEEAQVKLAQVQEARQTLANGNNRARYDEAGVNPTMEWRLLSPQVFYLHIKQFSPNTVQELIEATGKVDDRGEELDSLILDLRGNIGGAIDGLPYFLGPFIGHNQYAYQFIQQGQITDYKTRSDWLPSLSRYKKVIILIDGQVQSTAEVMASVLKKYNVGILVGTKTLGWGTIERVFPLNKQISDGEEYSVFLVHHLTLREDGFPIEGNGIEPLIDVQKSDWQAQLKKYFNDATLVTIVAEQFDQ